MVKASKGAEFEREMSKKFSLWWSHGERDDIFWRTQCSGGRATTRRKNGVETYGNTGDLKAEDPIGAPFTNLFSVEFKRGYNAFSFIDAMDRTRDSSTTLFEKFQHQADTQAWHERKQPMLVVRRDRHLPVMIISKKIFNMFYDYHGRFIKSNFLIYLPELKVPRNVLRLYDFFDWVAPETIPLISKSLENEVAK